MQNSKSLLLPIVLVILLVAESRSQKSSCKLLSGFNKSNNVLLANPRNCSTYIKCLPNGGEVLQSCRPGQTFDAATLTCSSADKANCQSSSLSSSLSSSSSSTAQPTTTTLAETETSPVVCPEQTSPEENVLLANPRDCRSFFHCSYGRPHLQLCPLGLHFNKRKASCDWVHKAKCQVLVDSTTTTTTTTTKARPPRRV